MLPVGIRQRVNGWRLGIQETGRLVAPLLGAGLFSLVGGGAVALNRRKTPITLQGRVSGAMSLALFGPQAPTQALGALLIAHASYAQMYAASALMAIAIGLWLARQPTGSSGPTALRP
jgi:hypothetical protein